MAAVDPDVLLWRTHLLPPQLHVTQQRRGLDERPRWQKTSVEEDNGRAKSELRHIVHTFTPEATFVTFSAKTVWIHLNLTLWFLMNQHPKQK